MGNNTSNDVEIFFQNNVFYFKGNKEIPICKQCYYCKCERFTSDEIKVLSDSSLTFEQFQTLDIGQVGVLTCLLCVSLDKIGPVRHIFRDIWMMEYNEPALTQNPFIKISNKIR